MSPSVYQRYLEKNLTDKYKSLDMQLEKTINEANAEIDNMQSQVKGDEPYLQHACALLILSRIAHRIREHASKV